MRTHDWQYIKGPAIGAIIGLIATSTILGATTISNPQAEYAGARATSLGGGSPVLMGETSAIFLNPAVMAEVDGPVADFSYSQPLVSFSTLSIVTAMPLYGFGAGFGFAQQSADNFYETTIEEDRIRALNKFSAGIRTAMVSLSKSFDHLWIFPKFSMGTNLKWNSQFIGADQRALISADFGGVSTLIRPVGWVDSLTVGASLINGVSSAAKWPNGLSGTFAPEIRLGATASTFNDKLRLFVQNEQRSPVIGAEYDLHSSVQLRAATDFSQFEIGLGIILDRLSGMGQSPVRLKFDYSYVQLGSSLNQAPWNSFTLRYLGLAQSSAPAIQLPVNGTHTAKDHIELQGIGPKNATISVISNGSPVKRVESDGSGYWSAEIPLVPGQNLVQAQAKSEESLSDLSPTLTVFSAKDIDHATPEFEIIDDRLMVRILRGTTQRPNGRVDTHPISFNESEGYWRADITNLLDSPIHHTVSSNFATISITPKADDDEPLSTVTVPIFLRSVQGHNNSQTYARTAALVGEVSPLISELKIAGNSVGFSQGFYTTDTTLKLGKNKIPFDATLKNGQALTLFLQITRLREFPDLLASDPDKRTIEGLATLGALSFIKQSEFSSANSLTLGNLVDFLSAQLGIDSKMAQKAYTFEELSSRSAPNESNYRLLVNRGILAPPTGSYVPNRNVTLGEVIDALAKAGLEVNAPNVGSDIPVKRREFVKILATSSEIQTKLTSLFGN